jgi:hypothetical protein
VAGTYRAVEEEEVMKFYRREDIEDLAERRLIELAKLRGSIPEPPIEIELIAEHVLGLDFLWEAVEELPGETVLAGINPVKRLIVMNEAHRTLFESKPGLERFTIGHEMGHWDLFVDKARLYPPPLSSIRERRKCSHGGARLRERCA